MKSWKILKIYETRVAKICEIIDEAYRNKEKIFSLLNIEEKMLPEKQLISVLPKTNKVKQARWLFFSCPGDKMTDSPTLYKQFANFYLNHKSFFDPKNFKNKRSLESKLKKELIPNIKIAIPNEFVRYTVSNAKRLYNEFNNNPLNILEDSDYKKSVKKLTEFLGYGEQVSRLFLIFLDRYGIRKIERLAPKIDRHILKISIGCGAVYMQGVFRSDQVVKELSRKFKMIFDVKKYDATKLDPAFWIIGHELCSRRDEAICKIYCPLDLYCDKNLPKIKRKNTKLYKGSKKTIDSVLDLSLPINHGKNKWDPDLPLSKYPEIEKIFREYAKSLYEDLEKNRQVVTLSEAPYPYTGENKIRVAVDSPPRWYSELYFVLKRSRKWTFRSLSRIINSKDGELKNRWYRSDSVLRDLIFKHLVEGYIIEENNKEYLLAVPDNEIRGFFGLKPLDLKEFEKHFENLEEKAYQSEIPF